MDYLIADQSIFERLCSGIYIYFLILGILSLIASGYYLFKRRKSLKAEETFLRSHGAKTGNELKASGVERQKPGLKKNK